MTLDVHVRRAIPGDVALIEVGNAHRRRIDASIVELLDSSPMRITPRCGHFPAHSHPGCGGCVFQSLDYRHQLAVKERRLKQLMTRAKIDPGLVDLVTPTSDDGWFYRNKMELSFSGSGESLACGLHPAGWRYEAIDQRECFLMSEFEARLPRRVRDWAAVNDFAAYDGRTEQGWLRTLHVREGKNTGERLVELVTAHDDGSTARAEAARRTATVGEIFGEDEITSLFWTEHRAVRGEKTRIIEHRLAGRPTLREELVVAGHTLAFEIHPRAFFQTNTRGAEILYEMVVEGAALSGDEVAIDLYCGTGTIALCVAPFVSEVLGIELVEDAVENARQNAALNGIQNVRFVAGDAGKVLAELRPQADVVIVDPPRKGLLRSAFDELRHVGARRLVYVSCNPEALVRDLGLLVRDGWKIERIRPIDMFPQTAHIESVVTLSR